jgi:hypothetical protein
MAITANPGGIFAVSFVHLALFSRVGAEVIDALGIQSAFVRSQR